MTDLAPPGSAESSSAPPLPDLDCRWVHSGSQQLDLLPTPITAASTTFKPFSLEESERIEQRWSAMTAHEKQQAIREWGYAEGEGGSAPASIKAAGQIKKSPKPSPGTLTDSEANSDGTVTKREVIMSGREQEEPEQADSRYKEIMSQLHRDNETLEVIAGVPVSQDSLFEVSLPTLSLHPVFWAYTGPRVSVIRGTWFVGDETRPCSWELGDELERAYLQIKPWQPFYKDELATAISLGSAAEEKLKHYLPSNFGPGIGIIFDDGEKGRLISTGSFLSRTILSSLRPRPAGTFVYRGFGAACAASGKNLGEPVSGQRSRSNFRRGSSSTRHIGGTGDSKDRSTMKQTSRDQDATMEADPARSASEAFGIDDIFQKIHDRVAPVGGASSQSENQEALEEETRPIVEAHEDDTPCTDLILVIHGIGQQLATQYESYSFVYAGNQLRQVIRKQAAIPALASIVRDRRCQVLPVQWRASLDLDQDRTAEDRQHGMDNRFTMEDITINKSIPYVRELTNSVLLDIPLFMSHHRNKMIEAVCSQANRLYRLWIARNPEFEHHGRVHIIGHSLGSALAAHILSNQPTKMPPLSQLPKQVITRTRDRFLFNTSNLFLCGSPLGIFLHLDQTQLMPRKGRERTMYSPQDEALDRSGKFGCMAIDSLYNIFYFTDPIAYQLNATIDARLATRRPPLAITSVTAPFFSSVTEGFGTISKYLPFGNATKPSRPQRPGAIRLPSGIEMSGPSGEERLEGSRGERRFSALNSHGNVDFYLPSTGPNEYLDMITAHASYWADASFAAFLLAEIFSTRLDLMRTGMGTAEEFLPDGELMT